MALSNLTRQYEGEVRDLRRRLHRIPEKGLAEFETSRFIAGYLRGLGLEPFPLATTGIKAVLRGGLPGPVTAIRADMDALNVQERTNCDFQSVNAGFMHACGHDGHMAMALAAAAMFAANREQVHGTVVFLFQPCEENVNGAQMLIAEGALQNPTVDRIFALHVMPHIPEGSIGVVTGAVMAGACEFEAKVHGRSAHGAMPHLGADAIVAAAQFVSSAQAVISRSKPPSEPGLLTIGRIEGGRRHNIIADEVVMEGTLRCYNNELMDSLKESLQAHMRGIEQAYGVQMEFQAMDEVPPTVNDSALAALALKAFPEACMPVEKLMVAEDFARYCECIPGFMGLLGCRNEARGFTEPLHSARFNFDEIALLTGLEFYKRIVMN